MEEHLGKCASCRSELESLRRTVALLQALPRVPVPRAFTLSEARAGIRRPEARSGWQGGLLRGLGAVAAIALVAFIATTMLRRSAWTPSATVARMVPTSAVTLQEAQPAAPAASAPADPEAVQEQQQLAEETVATVAVERAAAPASAATAPAASKAKAAPPPPPSQPQAAPAPDVQPPAEERQAVPTQTRPAAEPTQGGFAAAAAPATDVSTPAPAMLAAAAAPAAPAAAELGTMALGVGGGEPITSEVPAETKTPEPTPPLAHAGSVLPGKAGIAYTDGYSLWALDAASGAWQVLQSEGISSPQISSDRSRIAFRVQNEDMSDLWAVRWDGGDARLLLAERELPKDGLDGQYSERRIQETRWVPRQNVLAITTVAIPAPSAAPVLPKYDLWHLDVGTGKLTRVADLARFARPAYSPDGTQLAVLQYGAEADTQGSLALFKSDGAGGRVVLRFPASPTAPSYDSQIQWLPDSSGLLAAIPDVGPIEPGRNGMALYRVPVTGEPQKVGHADAFQVIWAPDGTRMAYTRAVDDSSDSSELYLANADGSDPQLYAPLKSGRFVNWSPDGSHFVYQSDYETYLGAPGQLPRRLGAEGSVIDPRWISAGQMLALHDTGTDWLVVIRGLDGNAVGLLPLSQGDSYDVTQP